MEIALETCTRDRILQAALELFSKQGFCGTSVRQIAAAVGLKASSLYNHFPGKEAIYAALVESFGPASSASRLAAAPYRTLREDPEAFCRKYAADLLDQWHDPHEQLFMELLAAERRRLSDERAHFFETLFSREAGAVTDYFRGFALRGLIRTPDPRECARLFMAGLTFIRMEHFLIPPRPSPRPLVSEALDRFVAHFLGLVAIAGGR